MNDWWNDPPDDEPDYTPDCDDAIEEKRMEYRQSEKECEANANLIAAAPELLKAAKAFLRLRSYVAEQELEKAIAKAELHGEKSGELL